MDKIILEPAYNLFYVLKNVKPIVNTLIFIPNIIGILVDVGGYYLQNKMIK